ncbi:Serine/threonine-protein phosphatase CPPED1 [Blattella germanica]|nr:Serine/threonine-protein phosphatase CPPED1 [Blattella germanica]
MRKRQIEDFKLIFEKLDPDIPLICLSGNHDIGNCPTAKTIDLLFFKDATNAPDLAVEHEKWLNEELDKIQATNSRAIVFQHIPWFLKDPDEENNYFSVDRNIRAGWLKRMEQAVTTAIGGQIGNDKPGLRIVKVLEKEVQQEFFNLDALPSLVHL